MPDGNTNPRTLTLEQADHIILIQHEEVRRVERRLPVIMAVANGAALTAVGARLTDTLAQNPTSSARILVALLFPSAVFFAIGLITSGFSLVLDVARSNWMLVSLQTLRMQIIDGDRQEMWVEPFNLKKFLTRWRLELLAASCFLLGLTAPIAKLAIGYAINGTFSW